jgi:hypothetical protein
MTYKVKLNEKVGKESALKFLLVLCGLKALVMTITFLIESPVSLAME